MYLFEDMSPFADLFMIPLLVCFIPHLFSSYLFPICIWSCSGITLTKLCGVIVLCFSRSEIFVVGLPLFCHSHVSSTRDAESMCASSAGLLLPNVSCIGPHRFLAWSRVSTSKLINLLITSYYLIFTITSPPCEFRNYTATSWSNSRSVWVVEQPCLLPPFLLLIRSHRLLHFCASPPPTWSWGVGL